MKRRMSHHHAGCSCPGCMSDEGDPTPPEDGAPPPTGPGGTTPDPAPAPKPHFPLSDIVRELTTNWDNDPKTPGTPRKWADKTVTYYIATDPTQVPDDFDGDPTAGEDSGYGVGEASMMAGRHDMAALAFELWDDLIDIELVETKTADSDIAIAYSSTVEGEKAYASPFVSDDGRTILAQRIWIDNKRPGHNWDETVDYRFNSFSTYVHEVGHSLGLSHPGPYNGTADYWRDAVYAEDTSMFTAMSYFGGWVRNDAGRYDYVADVPANSALRPQTAMLHDVWAIQQKYGAAAVRTGDTVYGFNATADREVFDFSLNVRPRLTIWDGGGDNDTLDVSGYNGAELPSWNQFINLNPGTHSSIGALSDNVAIAFDTWIEHAIGGGGHDQITGNARANRLSGGQGRDTIFGDDGNDTIDGGLGADTLAGGNHDDTYVVDNLGDTLVESLSGGYDKARIGVSGYTLAPNVERGELTITTGGTLTGNGGANVLYGNSGNDRLDGAGGNDQMHGGNGHDTYVVDSVGDRVFEEATGGKDIVLVRVNGYVLPAHVEDGRIDSAVGFTLTGNSWRNVLWGGEGRDTLYGAGSGDELHGGAENDWIDGGAGVDTLFGEGGNDTFIFARGEAHGDILADFNGNGAAAGDQIRLVGFGAGATLTQIDATHLDVAYGGLHEVITLRLATTLHASDWTFV